ncbi:NAD-dependent epimerase/dehydratase family protein [Pedobacter sp. MW01-1-1]|uniref:NAD-dependent epimerase/dehydratase family protein n=1 Tax=Pedobacter sp. MW01-1-1 TaxID=3383027 RepID=UPI003FF060F3
MKIILTGATGMVGEGVLLECLSNDVISEVLVVGRKSYPLQHPKLKELIVPDFLKIADFANDLTGFDACFFCAGISSIGLNEAEYTRITYDTTITFAQVVVEQNPQMVFNYVTGTGTDSSEQGKIMWARVKGKTENDLMKIGFKAVYNFRPSLMLPTEGQKNVKTLYRVLASVLKYVMRKTTIHLSDLAKAMILTVQEGYPTHVLRVSDIKKLTKS